MSPSDTHDSKVFWHSPASDRVTDLENVDISELFRAISELATDFVYSLRIESDGAQVLEWVTNGFERVTGYAGEEWNAIGGWEGIVYPEDLPVVGEVIARLQTTGQPQTVDFRIVTKQGTIRHLTSWTKPVTVSSTGALRLFGAAQDVTERKLAESTLRDREARFRAVMEGAADPILISDPGARLVDLNHAAQELLGYSRDELLGMSVARFIPPEELEREPVPIPNIQPGDIVVRRRRFIRKDGAVVPAEVKISMLENGLTVAIVRDLTDQQAFIEALEERERIFRAVSELTSDYAYSMSVSEDGSLDWEWVTDGFERIFGETPEQVHARGGWERSLHPDDVPAAAVSFQRLLTEHEGGTLEFRIVRGDGEIRHVWSSSTPVVEDGRVVRLLGAVQDVTERKLAEERLQEQTELHESVLSAQSDLGEGIAISDLASGKIVYTNDAMCRIFGFVREELLAFDSFFDLLAPEQRAVATERAEGIGEGTLFAPFEMTALRKDGVKIQIEAVSKPLGDGKLISLVRDVTERTEAERLLRESEARFRNLYDRLPIGVYQRSWNGHGIDANPAAVEMFRHPSKESFLSMPASELYVDQADLQRWVELLEGEGVAQGFETRLYRYDGSIMWARNTGRLVRDRRGAAVSYEGAVEDITETKRKEAEILESNSLLRATLESTADGILVVDARGRTSAYNRKFVDMWRIPSNVLESGDDEKLIQSVLDQLQDSEGFVRKVRHLYDHPDETSHDVLEFKDGRAFERFSQPQKLGDRVEGRVWSFRDITESREADRQIRQALEALRRSDDDRRGLLNHLVHAKEDERNRVASDIHDDSVQIMTTVAIGLERLSRQATTEEQKQALARLEDVAREAIARLRKMVFELRPPSLDEEGLAPALRLYLEEFRIETEIEYELSDELGREPSSSLRVLLYRIAQEALTNVKKHARAHRVGVLLKDRDDGIEMLVADDGIGFLPPRLSESAPGHIGIAEMRERAEMAGGIFDVDGAPGSGTTVRVWVPGHEEPAS